MHRLSGGCWSEANGMIYFIRGVHTGRIKIGTSINPEQRLRSLQTGSPEPLEMMGVIQGGPKEEKILHKRFKRFGMHGEWFKPDPDLVYEIKAMLVVPIEELIRETKGTFWRIAGQTIRGANVTQKMDLFCVHRNLIGAEKPDPNDMVSAVCVGAHFQVVERMACIARKPEQWPIDLEMLRQPLTSKNHRVWVMDMLGEQAFFPVLPYHQRVPLPGNLPPHVSDAFKVDTIVFHAEHGVGRLIYLEMRGPERVARIRFANDEDRLLYLFRAPVRLATPEEAEALKPKPMAPSTWRPKWMDEDPMF